MAIKHKHLTLEERCHIFALNGSGISQNQIAKHLGRHRSVIFRELARNSIDKSYRPDIAQNKYCTRKIRAASKPRKMVQSLQEIIIARLKLTWSPEQISGRLKAENIANISHESIYKMIWKDKQNGGLLYQNLRHSGKKYNKRNGKNSGRGLIPNRIDIELRDKIVDTKSRFGDWEADTVIGANHQGAIVTLVDRKSKFAIFKLASNRTKESVTRAIQDSLSDNLHEVLTITFDNGKEFAGHQDIAAKLNTQCFFAKPYHPWERGLNEHTNGLLRQFIPKKSDFRNISQENIDYVQNLINNRPRKVLGYFTPTEVFFATVAFGT